MTATYRLSEALSAILVLIAPTIIPAAEVGHPSTWALREPLEDFCLPEHKVLNGFTIGSAELNWIYNGTKVQRVDAEGVCHRCNDHIAGMWHQLHLLSMGTAIRLEVEPIIYTEQPYREDPSPVVDVFSRYKGVSGNLGMYASGIPIGLLVDAKGPKPGVYLGCAMLGIGYFALYSAYNDGPGVTGMPWLCLSGFLTGAGGCAAFSASIKTSALNWPTHRGTATAFPLSAFGLSAFFFSSISTVAFPDNTSRFLLMLAIGTFGMTFISSFFLRVIPPPSTYSAVSSDEYRGGLRSSRLHRSRSGDSKHGAIREPSEPGMHHAAPNGSFPLSRSESENAKTHLSVPDLPNTEADETSSLMSKSSVSGAGDLEENGESTAHDPHHLDIRGMALLPKIEFWELFILLGLLTGIGLMTINNIGNDAGYKDVN
ncbi:hypothetical protein MMC26_005646 [Xylographa opegraphella]|nr:hypothetical protein [Xylographa opegraphella]